MEGDAEPFPWHFGVHPLLPTLQPGVPGLQQRCRGCWHALGPAPFTLTWPSWANQVSFLNQSMEDERAFSKGELEQKYKE